LTPERTLIFKGEKCTSGKPVEDCNTILVCANVDKTEKRKIFVTGKSNNPRCLKNIKCTPVWYSKKSKILDDLRYV
jgi:hypothetical protein